MSVWHNSAVGAEDAVDGAAERRALGLLLEGAAINLLQPDADAYAHLRSAILRDSIRLVEPQTEEELLQTVQSIVHEFDSYRAHTEAVLEERQKAWRHVVAVLSQLLAQQGRQAQGGPVADEEEWASLRLEISGAASAAEIQGLGARLLQHFERSIAAARQAELDEEQDRSEANDNAAGLRGGGAAIQHVQTILTQGRPGYVGIFRLSCLDVVGERFGQEGIQDCLMAVSAFLIDNLRAEDSVYHWSESSLLVVHDRKIREDILLAELNRVLQRNRDFTIQIGDSTIMLRIPIELELFPIDTLKSADDLQKIPARRGRADRSLSDRSTTRSHA
jgi:GGDEF domain-containing protein